MPLHKDIRAGSGVTLEFEDRSIDALGLIIHDARQIECSAVSVPVVELEKLHTLLTAKTRIRIDETPDSRADGMVRATFDAPSFVRVIFPRNDEQWGNR